VQKIRLKRTCLILVVFGYTLSLDLYDRLHVSIRGVRSSLREGNNWSDAFLVQCVTERVIDIYLCLSGCP